MRVRQLMPSDPMTLGPETRPDEELVRDVNALLASVGLTGWRAEVSEGRVALREPENAGDRAFAHLVAGTVPGVIEVVRP